MWELTPANGRQDHIREGIVLWSFVGTRNTLRQIGSDPQTIRDHREELSLPSDSLTQLERDHMVQDTPGCDNTMATGTLTKMSRMKATEPGK